MKCLFKLSIIVLTVFLSLGLIAAQTVKSESKLSLNISKTEKQWGEFLNVTLRYRGVELLENINLQSWQQFVAITHFDEYQEKDQFGRTIQVKKLRLHPRYTGNYQLPQLQLAGATTASVSISISDAQVKNHQIKLESVISTLSPWQRQAVKIKVLLETSDSTARLKLEPIKQSGIVSKTLKPVKTEQLNGQFLFEGGWVIYPVQSGFLSLDLPVVEYRLSGSSRRKFHLPLLELNVKPLPAYLPPTLPIGELMVSSEISTGASGENQWIINVRSDALIPYGVPDLDGQLAELNHHDINDIIIQNSLSPDHKNQSIYHVPLPDWLSPIGRPLKINLRYFDPDSRKLVEVEKELPRQLNLPAWAWKLLMVLLLLMMAVLIWSLMPRIKKYRQNLKLHKQLKLASNPLELRETLLKHGGYVSLSQWAGDSGEKKKITAALNKYCFSGVTGIASERLSDQVIKERA